MKKLLQIISLLIVCCVIFLAWVFIPNHTSLGEQITKHVLTDHVHFVGYQLLSTDPAQNNRFSYFILTEKENAKNSKPFLVTSDPFVQIQQTGEHRLMVKVHGRVYQYHNDIWTKQANGKVLHWYVSTNNQYIR